MHPGDSQRVSLKPRGKRPLGSLNAIFREQLERAPKIYLENGFKRIIKGKIPNASDELVEALANHVMTSPCEPFEWDDGTENDTEVKISIDAADLQPAIDDAVRFMKEDLPDLAKNMTDSCAKSILRSLKADWPVQRAHDQARRDQFNANLEAVWGTAFDRMRMMYTIAVEIGTSIAVSRRRSRSKRNAVLNDTMLRMHARACQVFYEIMTLVENGLADGAFARWRTLHEITVVSSLLVEHGEELAIRYRAHEAVEAKRALDKYLDRYETLRFKRPPARSVRHTQSMYDACLEQYGDNFGSEYGWAAVHLGIKKPRFIDLEAAAGKTAMHSYYRLASYNVHAGSKGIMLRIGSLDRGSNSRALAGVSNVGFIDPAQNAASDLIHITTLLSENTTRADRIIEWKILGLLRDELVKSLVAAQRSIERADKAQRERTQKRQKPTRAPRTGGKKV